MCVCRVVLGYGTLVLTLSTAPKNNASSPFVGFKNVFPSFSIFLSTLSSHYFLLLFPLPALPLRVNETTRDAGSLEEGFPQLHLSLPLSLPANAATTSDADNNGEGFGATHARFGQEIFHLL